jgi:hypothetical protein
MSERRRWGRAGCRLPASTAEGRQEQLREARAQAASQHRMVARDQETRRRYKAGLVVPHYITLALDVAGLRITSYREADGVPMGA